MSERPNRREFLEGASAALLAGVAGAGCGALGGEPSGGAVGPGGATPGAGAAPGASAAARARDDTERERVVVSTWRFGTQANAAAWGALQAGVGHPIDACETGVKVIEADPTTTSVGYGGLPDADGEVTLDACIMRGDTLACGGVADLRRILHPVSVARAVMETTPHVLLVGEGALAFARARGFPEQDLLTDASRAAWERWRAEHVPPSHEESHDTIGQIVLEAGRFGMAVTTSGLAYKLPGRVGDSPLVGAGGYCDDAAGACVATGMGEEIIRSCGSFAVVERMRQGAHPQEACEQIVARVLDNLGRTDRTAHIALLAVDRRGRVGAASLPPSFQYAITDPTGARLVEVEPTRS